MRKPGSASNSTVWSTLVLPRIIEFPQEFEKSIVQIRRGFTGIEERGQNGKRFLNLMYYLLGWMVGDAGKNFSATHSWARFELSLSRKYPENLDLGNFVMSCIAKLGIPCGRIADGLSRKRDPNGMYRWMSYFSEVFFWLHTACVGLRQDELTSYDRVRMNWLLLAAPEHRRWFIRGLADSDATVNVRNRTVVITTEPNTAFIKTLYDSLNYHALSYISRGAGYVSITAGDAMELQIFNPEVETRRGRLLQQLAGAKTFQGRWPEWLGRKVNLLLREGLDISSIRNRILRENQTYIKLKTIKAKQLKMK